MIGQWVLADDTEQVTVEAKYIDENVCPLCESQLSSRAGLGQHTAMKHGFNLRREAVCDVCGAVEIRKNSHVKKGSVHYCSVDCESEHKTGRDVPEDHNFRKSGKIAVECDYCGSEFRKYPSVAEQSEMNFCDRDCHSSWQSECRPKEEHNWYNGGPEIVECSQCGESIERKPSMAKKRKNHFCSDACSRQWKSENRVGPNHPNWQGYSEGYYGKNWPEQRQKRLEKDGYECVVCGISQEEHKSRHGRGLDVHHIQPIEDFRGENTLDWETANRIENLLSLCIPCHKKWEGLPVGPEVKS
jgi:5-methylcytosine-specific restriction endonuclease McrA